MTKLEQIKTEIARQKKQWMLHQSSEAKYRLEMLDELQEFVDSLPEEPVSEGLKKEVHNYVNDNFTSTDTPDEFLTTLMQEDDMISFAQHFADWQKEQMMKNVILSTEIIQDSAGDGIEIPYEKWLTLKETETHTIPDNLGFKNGDKVKIILIKEE